MHLSVEQWSNVLAASRDGKFAHDTASLATQAAVLEDDSISSVVFVLALEGRDTPDPSWSTWQALLDSIVQMAQPAPRITHVELLVPPSSGMKQNMHFSTYICERAQWWDNHANNRAFYLGSNAGHWRAVPVSCKSAAQRVRIEANQHVGTAYSLARYACAVPPMRALASLVPDAPLSSAHCGTLTARVLQRALGEVAPKHSPSWYSPTTLFLEMSSGEKRETISSFLTDTSSLKSVAEEEEETLAMHHLLHGSDDEVRTLTDHACRSAIRSLATRACSEGLDDTARRIVQKQLATALLRYSLVNQPK